jgi:hypothetical protein
MKYVFYTIAAIAGAFVFLLWALVELSKQK